TTRLDAGPGRRAGRAGRDRPVAAGGGRSDGGEDARRATGDGSTRRGALAAAVLRASRRLARAGSRVGDRGSGGGVEGKAERVGRRKVINLVAYACRE